ncbi:hypothetical protein A0O00_03065 [Proteus mirabilis]|nr:hypothetical protein A0O00_03065 [Proteus mirabilis]
MLINLCDYKIIKCISNGNFSNLGYMNSFTKQIAKKIKINNEEDFNVYFLSLLDSEFLANSAKDYDIDDEDYNADYCSSLMLALYLTILQIKK